MIMHIISNTVFAPMYIKFININFGNEIHKFIIYGENKYLKIEKLTGSNLIFIKEETELKNYKIYLGNSEKIIIHGLFGIEIKILFLNPMYLKKMYLVFWGGDIYSFRNKIMYKDIKGIFKKILKKYIIANSCANINLTKEDYMMLCRYCKPAKKHFIANYIEDEKNWTLKKKIRNIKKMQSPYMILVGNSATVENQHLEILEKLAVYKNENIQIICPLSYGNQDYSEKVIENGKKIFGDKFKELTEYMYLTEYWELLNKCCVGIFNNNRQQGMGNIISLGYFGAKVYIRHDTSMWREFIHDAGCCFFDVENVGKVNFKEFISISDKDIETNYNRISEWCGEERSVKLWKTIFQDK